MGVKQFSILRKRQTHRQTSVIQCDKHCAIGCVKIRSTMGTQKRLRKMDQGRLLTLG